MNYIKLTALSIVLIFCFTLVGQAQTTVVLDPNGYFDQHATPVTLHMVDGNTAKVNLIYNTGTTLYYKEENNQGVGSLPLTVVKKIEYPDGSIEMFYVHEELNDEAKEMMEQIFGDNK